MIKANLISGKITSNSIEANRLFEKRRFGEKQGQKILYSIFETLFLVENNKMEIHDFKDKKIPTKELEKKLSKMTGSFHTKYLVFKNLREKGYTPKTALKFGADFRVYNKGDKISSSHSRWICFAVSERESNKWQDFVAKNRVAHLTKKNLLIAIVDDEGDISYFETNWIKV